MRTIQKPTDMWLPRFNTSRHLGCEETTFQSQCRTKRGCGKMKSPVGRRLDIHALTVADLMSGVRAA